jgi:hypothetical protein
VERRTQRDWFTCPRCGTHAEQTWLSARPADALPAQWSTCSACRQITIWRPGAASPAPGREAGAAGGDDPPAGAALDSLWEAITGYLGEPEDAPPRRQPPAGA